MLRALLRIVPDPLLVRMLPRGQRFDPGVIPPIPAAPSTGTRLFIGPLNLAGQGWAWARAAERNLPDTGAVAMSVPRERDFAFPADQEVPYLVYRWSGSWRSEQLRALTRDYTHLIVESARPLFGDAFAGTLREDLRRFRSSPARLALLFHGSDIRLPSRHAEHAPWSTFRGDFVELTATMEAVVRKNLALVEELDLPLFVSTPDLLLDLPTAQWLPVVVDPAVWRTHREPFSTGEPPIVAHAPSRESLKGSDLIDPILQRLEAEGLLRYRRVEKVPSHQMPSVYKDADIVIDQARLGIYGVAACEAMAAGRVVVSHVSEQVRGHVLAETGRSLPIVEATPDVLEETIRSIVADPTEHLAVAAAGVTFVEAVHDGRVSAERLRAFLEAGPARPAKT